MIPGLRLLFAALSLRQNPQASLLSFDVASAKRSFVYEEMTPEDDPTKREEAQQILTHALARYPQASVPDLLSHVFVVRHLRVGKAEYGGMNNRLDDAIVLAVGDAPTIDGDWMEHAIHHELAHLLQVRKGARFPTKEWRRANAPGFRYASEDGDAGSYAALAGGKTGRSFDPALNEQGLLSEYCTSALNEDWACLAEEVVADNPKFWDAVARYPRLKSKAKLAVAFYRRVVPGIGLRDVE